MESSSASALTSRSRFSWVGVRRGPASRPIAQRNRGSATLHPRSRRSAPCDREVRKGAREGRTQSTLWWAAPRWRSSVCKARVPGEQVAPLIGAPRSAAMRIYRARRRRSVSSASLARLRHRRSLVAVRWQVGPCACTRGLLALIALAALGWRRPARAAPPTGGSAPQGTHKHGPSGKKAVAEADGPPTQLTSPSQLGVGTLATELGATGQVDPLSGLGIRNPVCDQLAQIRSRADPPCLRSERYPRGQLPGLQLRLRHPHLDRASPTRSATSSTASRPSSTGSGWG